MFTGIVEEVGTVASLEVGAGRARLEVACAQVVADAAIGDSIAVDGCCLTVAAFLTADGERRGFAADLMAETLRATALGDLEAGAGVNLERALRADARFGGHLVQGHVDGVGEVVTRDEQPGTIFVTVLAPPEVGRYLVAKGSITVSGVSLTVVDVDDGAGSGEGRGGVGFRIGLIPHTLAATTFGAQLLAGARVNLEADVVAKYVERLLAGGTASPYATAANVPEPPHAAQPEVEQP